jgi:Deacetylase PdaC/Protein of unknown function (DUF3298)
MKRIVAYVLASLFTFTCGVVVTALFLWQRHPPEKPPATPVVAETPTLGQVKIPEPSPQIVFGGGKLKIVSEEVKLKSESLQYDLHARYPQITGTDTPHIQRLNRRIKELATKEYERWMYPTKKDLIYYRKIWPEAFNELSIDYEVTLATDSILSIYFVAYSYGIGAGTSVQYSLTINYDLVSHKELKLSELFTRRSGYLDVISDYCIAQLEKHKYGEWLFRGNFAPEAANFDSWNVTRDGIRFNFDECEAFGCAAGPQTVEIPFSEIKSILSPRAVDFAELVRR